MRVLEEADSSFAADAFAQGTSAGIGGWWTDHSDGQVCIRWFSQSLTASTLPPWIVGADGQSLRTRIAALECAAQLALLLGRCAHSTLPSRCMLRLRPLCDNMGIAAAAGKNHSMSEPLCFVLQAVGFHSSRLGVSLDPYHVTGHPNTWADQLSRGDVSGFDPKWRLRVKIGGALATS